MFDTIAAISSGYINQAISIIRITGPDSFKIINKLFQGKVGENKTLTFGKIIYKQEIIDEVMVAWFHEQDNFIGERLIEIYAHGGVINSNRILELILTNGARLAERGEFSKRAFLNGKIDLIKAEAINDLINASTNLQAKMSVAKFQGQTSKTLLQLKRDILNLIATCEVNIDYPEYDDIEILTTKNLLPRLDILKQKINQIIKLSQNARVSFQGINVAIIGAPNVGKSSLLNAILEENKAIVTNIPGTTRDVVEGQKQIGHVLLKLKDTAGIHQTPKQIEKLGIKKSLIEIDNADLVIHLFDSQKKKVQLDSIIQKKCQKKVVLKVWNKVDLIKASDRKSNKIYISAKNHKIKNLYQAIITKYPEVNVYDRRILNNTRQLALMQSSLIAINDAIKGLKKDLTPDVVIIDLQKAWEDISNIMGNVNKEDLLDQMFKHFCLGK